MTKRHETLRITFAELGALLGTREMLKADILEHAPTQTTKAGVHEFDMNTSCKRNGECGTVSCIGGTMALIMGLGIFAADQYVRNAPNDGGEYSHSSPLGELFYPGRDGYRGAYEEVTPAHAVAAIDNFLLFGRPKWREVMDDSE